MGKEDIVVMEKYSRSRPGTEADFAMPSSLSCFPENVIGILDFMPPSSDLPDTIEQLKTPPKTNVTRHGN